MAGKIFRIFTYVMFCSMLIGGIYGLMMMMSMDDAIAGESMEFTKSGNRMCNRLDNGYRLWITGSNDFKVKFLAERPQINHWDNESYSANYQFGPWEGEEMHFALNPSSTIFVNWSSNSIYPILLSLQMHDGSGEDLINSTDITGSFSYETKKVGNYYLSIANRRDTNIMLNCNWNISYSQWDETGGVELKEDLYEKYVLNRRSPSEGIYKNYFLTNDTYKYIIITSEIEGKNYVGVNYFKSDLRRNLPLGVAGEMTIGLLFILTIIKNKSKKTNP